VFSSALTSPARFTKGIALVVSSLLVAAVLSVFAPALAANAATATLTVNVTGGGSKASNVDVYLYEYDADWDGYDYVSQLTTGDSGSTEGLVKFTGVPTGSSHKYVIQAAIWSSSALASGDISDYTDTYLGASAQYNRVDAGLFSLSGTASKTVALKTSFSISGTVYSPDESTTAPGADNLVTAYKLDQDGYYTYAGNVYSDEADGTYTLRGLAPADYKLRFEPAAGNGWGGVWYGNAANRVNGSTATISTANVTNIDAAFADGGTIHGTVGYLGGTLPADGSGSVSAQSLDGSMPAEDSYASFNDDGSYSLSLAPGEYRIQVAYYDNNTGVQYSEWYNDEPTFGTAASMTVTTGSDETANVDLGDGFTLSGTVKDTANTPLGGWGVQLIGVQAEGSGSSQGTESNSLDGSYEFATVTPGAYRVVLNDNSGDDQNTYYLVDDGTVTTNEDDAEIIRAVSGTVTRDVTFPVTAQATVTVLSPSGTALKGAYVSLLPSVNGTITWDGSVNATATSSSSGVYRATGLVAGQDYTVYVGGTPTGNYDQYLGGAFTEDEATLFTASAGENSVTFSLSPAVAFTGKVTSSAGKAIKNAVVEAYYFDGSSYIRIWSYATTSSTGAWSMKGLRAGSYKFAVYHPYGSTYIDAFSGNAATMEDAQAVYIGPGKTVSVTVKLATGGTLSGVIKGEGGAAFTGYGTATKLIGNPTDGFTGTEAGYYYGDMHKGKLVFAGLPTGYYAVGYGEFNGGDPVYPFTYIGGPSPLEGTSFTVTAGKTTTFPAVTALAHPHDASLTGTVHAPSGDLDQYYTLTYQRVGAPETMDSATVAPDGSFSVPNLAAGDYLLGIYTGKDYNYPPTFTYEPYYDTVTIGSGVSNVDLYLSAYTPLEFVSEPSASTDDIRVGESASVSDGGTNFGADFSYQWYRQTEGPDTRTLIRGATANHYTARPSDYGSTLFVRETATQTVGTSDFTVATKTVSRLISTGLVTEGYAPENTVKPSITPSGTVLTDTVLHVQPGTWDQQGLTFTYQWYVNGSQVAGAAGTAKSYTVTPTNGAENDEITVGVVAHGSNRGDSDDEISAPVMADTAAAPTLLKAPKITVKGSHFTVSGGTWSRSGTTTDYLWSTDGSDFSAGTSFTYTGTGAVSLEVSGVKAGYETGHKAYLARKGTTAPTSVDIPPYVVGVTVTDDVNVGVPLTALGGVSHFADGSVNDTATFQWYSTVGAGTPKAISKATKQTYTPTAADLGKAISVKISIGNANYGPYAFTAAGGNVVTGNLTFGSGTTVSGYPNLGRTLTARTPHYAESGVTYTYQWYTYDPDTFNLTDITDATKSTFTPTPPRVEAGQSVVVIVTAHKSGYEDAESGSTPLEIGDGTIQNITTPVVTPGGIVTTGTTLTTTAGTWDIASPTISYQWMRNGGLIPGATAKTYKVTAADDGLPITVIVHAAKTGFGTSDDVSSNTVTGHATGVSTEAPIVNGTLAIDSPQVGVAGGTSQSAYDLFSYLGDDDSANPKLAYQWYLGSTAIKGATSSTYTPPASSVGKSLWLKVTVTSPYYAKSTQSTTPQPVATGTQVEGTVSFNPTSSLLLGTKLTAVPSGWASTSTLSYQWQRDTGTWADISGATKSTYTLGASDVNANVRVMVTAKRTGYTTVDVVSDDAHVDYTDSVVWLDGPTLTGTAVTGGTLSVATGVLNTSGVTFQFQWYANGAKIPGATSSSIVIAPALAGHTLSATVIAKKVGFSSATADTDEKPVANATTVALSGKGPKISADTSTCNRLKVSPGTWSVGGLTLSYQWYRGAVGTTAELLSSASTYDMLTPEIHDLVWVKVTAHGTGYDGIANSTAFTETPTGSCG
jgi:hypothetical protein